jgi:hypothetical protein
MQPIAKNSSKGLYFYIIPLLLFSVLSVCVYHFYQYRIISDDFSYLAIAQRYITGDYKTAINGYWSPLNIWILALWVKATGMALLPSSYIINCCSFAVLIALTISLSRRFVNGSFERMGLGVCMSVFCAFNIPVTHFADAMNCSLLLLCFGIMIKKDFVLKPQLWLLWGLVAAIAYFSKAYSFYILPLTLAIGIFILLKKEGLFSLKKWGTIFAVSVGCFLLLSFPWIFLLHQKYGLWAISTAGGVNTNWAIESHIYFSDTYKILVPPAYANGLSCWEDPWINHAPMLSPLSSAHLLVKQLFRMCMNALNWFSVTAQFSPFYFPIWLAGLFYLLKRKIKDKDVYRLLLVMTFLIFPAGYLMLSFGNRYLWFTVPLIMLSGLFLLKQYLASRLSPLAYKVLLLVYFISWLPGSLQDMKVMFKEGKGEYEMAQEINRLQIHGSFLTNIYDNYQTGFRLSWFTQNAFYMHFGDNWTTQELLAEAQKQHVKYYYYFYQGTNDNYQLLDVNGKPFPEVSEGKLEGLKIFRIDQPSQ